MGWYEITDDYIKDSKINIPVCETLQLRDVYGGTQRTIYRVDQSGRQFPVWTVNENIESGVLAIVSADPRAQVPAGNAVGIIKYHTMSSRTQITLRRSELSLGLTDYSHGHEINFNGCNYRWVMSKNTMSTNTLYLKTEGNRILARWSGKPEGREGDPSPVFELFVPPQTLDMDFLVVTGLAAAGYWKKADKLKSPISKILKIMGGLGP
ncbi:hypothetical protein CLIM01_02148 [Colletotrichum limetticola]|uniref:Uncharacterized protein n=1 Tax=Colletotrichum limetticola TaxID=1209924 RepID=A0ABQ9Q9X9_9PEZI|nr:hypothetical protein CLIM01_02148 [Colletotrichum limetticola]